MRLDDPVERESRADLVNEAPGLAQTHNVPGRLVLGSAGHRVDQHWPDRGVLGHQRVEGQFGFGVTHRGVGGDGAVDLEHLGAHWKVGAEVDIDDAIYTSPTRELENLG